MLDVIEESPIVLDADVVGAEVIRVSNRFPPLWDLRNYVAVNPFLGFTAEPVIEASRSVLDGLGGRLLPGIDYYRERWQVGAFQQADLLAAARRVGCQPEVCHAIFAGEYPMPTRLSQRIVTFAELYDEEHGTDWTNLFIGSAARWCAVHTTGGGTYWPLPQGSRGLFQSWRETALSDRTYEISGLQGFRKWVSQLPEDPLEAIVAAIAQNPVPEDKRADYFYRLLSGVYGWASYLRRSTWAGEVAGAGELTDLLAIRVCLDTAVALQFQTRQRSFEVASVAVEDETVLMAFQEALEDSYVHKLVGNILPASESGKPITRPGVQAVFCIDVRSEPLRRHLEAQSPQIETRGFAGFFGIALNWQTEIENSPRCPVLLKPGVSVRACCDHHTDSGATSLKYVQAAPVAAFSYVELIGLGYGLGLAGEALTAIPTLASTEARAEFDLEDDAHGNGLSVSARLDTACGILKNMGFQKSFARLVLLCGHESHSANNPHAAGLDCGACGGHGGAINARVAAALLNDPIVRAGLPARGWQIPRCTHFLPAVHDTATEQVQLLDVDRVPTEFDTDIVQLRVWLSAAGEATRAERAPSLGLGVKPSGLLSRLFGRRSRDWAEVRPEWGLARNAAFIAARRSRTRGIDLHGRAFLHEYDAANDPDDSILTLILSAPMVVASWINLQYFASTVDNDVFGCGDKTLHNRVGTLGVVLGNGGDLRTGLPLQSVHSEKGSWFHEPLRLQVIVEATPEQIDRVLAAQPGVNELVENGWVRLFALSPNGPETFRRAPGQGWERVNATEE